MSEVLEYGHRAGSEPNDLSLLQEIREGLPVDLVDRVLESGTLSLAELDRLALPRKTLAHRRGLGRLSREQSDHLVRILRVIAEAERTFGRQEKARIWLRCPSAALAGNAPLDLLDTEIGARKVETLLGRIAHGIAA